MRTASLSTLVPRDVMAALAAIGIDADERGDEAVALCPHPDHDDSHASWSCNLDTGQHHCFSCGFGGSFTLLVGRMLGVTRAESDRWITERKIKDVAEGHTGPRVRKPREAAELSEADLWKFTDPPAEALASRGLTLESCQKYGVRWDAERELWITPVRDPRTSRLWGWQEKNARYFRNRPLDIQKSRSLFGLQSLRPGGTAVIVESPLDVPYVDAAGVDGAVSGYGVSVSREQVALVAAHASQVVLALDNDRAGWKGVSKLAYVFGTVGVRVFNYGSLLACGASRVVLEDTLDGTDPGNLSPDELAWGVQHAVPAWRIKIPWLS